MAGASGPAHAAKRRELCFWPADNRRKTFGGSGAEAYARQAGSGCRTVGAPRIDGDSANLSLECPTLSQQIQTRRVNDNSWELRVVTAHKTQGLGAAPAATGPAKEPKSGKPAAPEASS